MKTRAARRFLALGALALALGCGAAQRGGPSRNDAVVSIRCNVAQAALFVDGRYLAPVGLVRGGVALPPGRHRLELRHPEHLSRLLELEVAAAERRTVTVELFPALP